MDSNSTGRAVQGGFDRLSALSATHEFAGSVEAGPEHAATEHAALVYDSTASPFGVALPVIEGGLAAGERCLYVMDGTDREDLLAALADRGVDVTAALEGDRLQLLEGDAYVTEGSFSPDEQVDRLVAAIEDGVAAHGGCHIVVDMTWFRTVDDGYDRLVEFEEKANHAFRDASAMAVCQYDRAAFPDAVIEATVRAHPQVVHDGSVGHNPLYRPPEETVDGDRGVLDRVLDSIVDGADLPRAERQTRRLVETAPVPIVLYTCAGVVYANEAAADLLGVPDADALAGAAPTSFVHPDDRERARAQIDRVLTEGVAAPPGDIRLVDADGTTTDVVVASTPVEFEGQVAGQAVIKDVSDQKDRERALERQNERLAEFASIVSHDLRNPLNVVSGRLELARETGDPAHFDAMAHAVDRMDAIIEDTLTLARQGQIVGETERHDLAGLVRTAWGSVATGAATLTVDGRASLACDEERLVTMLENLVRNAVDHGGDAVAVRVEVCEDGFAVADDGPGIPPADRDRVLERGVTTADEGTGFGLSIVREIADAHGWSVAVGESEDGGARLEVDGVTSLRRETVD